MFGFVVYYMPALSWVVIVPLAGCVMIELGRRAIRRTARSAHYDPLTGLRNRRGMYAAVQARAGSCDVVAMAVCDIDQFKRLNDAAGHAAGDAALVAAAVPSTREFNVDDLVARADSAMYGAKRAGGGGCVVHQDPAVAPRASLAPTASTKAAAAGRRPYPARRA